MNRRQARPWVLLVLLNAPGVMWACGSETGSGQAAREREPVEVILAPVTVRSAERAISVTGTLFGEEETTISSKLSGRIVSVVADIGDAAEPAAPLAQIDTRDYELALAERQAAVQAALARIGLNQLPGADFDPSIVPTVVRARAQAANAEARFERGRQLFEQKPPEISEQDFEDLRTSLEVARSTADVELLTARAVLAEARTRAAEAAAAAQQLEDTTIRAPGKKGDASPRYRVSERLVSLGEYVNEGRAIVRLVASDLIKFRADVPERYAGEVRSGQSAAVSVESAGGPARGSVARVSPRIDPASRTFEIEIHIDNKDGALKPGAFARGSVTTRIDERVAFVPRDAVVTFAGVQKIFSVKDGKAVEHRVETGAVEEGLVEIRGEFAADSVVLSGAAALTDGAPVKVVTP